MIIEFTNPKLPFYFPKKVGNSLRVMVRVEGKTEIYDNAGFDDMISAQARCDAMNERTRIENAAN